MAIKVGARGIKEDIMEKIVGTIPISFFTKTKKDELAVGLTNESTSYYAPKSAFVGISKHNINEGLLAKYGEGVKVNKRKLYYTARTLACHEFSHVIFTPTCANFGDPKLNVFEDYRIERNTGKLWNEADNYRKQVFYINGYKSIKDIPAPTSAWEMYYQIVRFNIGPEQFIKKRDEIYDKYKHITSQENWLGTTVYIRAIRDFYDEIQQYCAEDEKQNQEPDNNMTIVDPNGVTTTISSNNVSDNDDDDNDDDYGGDDEDEDDDDDDDNSDSENENQGEDDDGENGNGMGNGLTDEEITAACEQIFTDLPSREKFTTKIKRVIDEAIRERDYRLGSATAGYTGKINPRNLQDHRDDLKWFNKDNHGDNLGKSEKPLHLNLIIDCSSSFRKNDGAVNTILGCLRYIERKSKLGFSFDIATIGCGTKYRNKKNWIHCSSDGDTYFGEFFDMSNVFNQMHKPETKEQWIFLVDGGIRNAKHTHGKSRFEMMNHRNWSIISDRSNEEGIKNYAPLATAIINRGGESYSELLADRIVYVLKKGFNRD